MKLPEINAKTFYTIGKYAFFVNALIGLIKIVDLWSVLKSYDIFSNLASSIFYFVLSGFFAKLQKEQDVTEITEEELFGKKSLDDLENKNAKKR